MATPSEVLAGRILVKTVEALEELVEAQRNMLETQREIIEAQGRMIEIGDEVEWRLRRLVDPRFKEMLGSIYGQRKETKIE